MDVFSTDLGIRLSFVKTSELGGGGEFEIATPTFGMPLVQVFHGRLPPKSKASVCTFLSLVVCVFKAVE
jgi:hypothetical protein